MPLHAPDPQKARPARRGPCRRRDARRHWRAHSPTSDGLRRAAAPRSRRHPSPGEALAGRPTPRVREAMFTALAESRRPTARRSCCPICGVDDANMRTGALDALRAMPQAAQAIPAGAARRPGPGRAAAGLRCSCAARGRRRWTALACARCLKPRPRPTSARPRWRSLAEIGDAAARAGPGALRRTISRRSVPGVRDQGRAERLRGRRRASWLS